MTLSGIGVAAPRRTLHAILHGPQPQENQRHDESRATYPECGHFRSPDWEFIDVIPPDELARKAHDWQHLGASIFGGCCGIGPDHIGALTSEFKTPRIR
jgi:S-methylmethionine-dependent homocysteine/selenocysteine methylase